MDFIHFFSGAQSEAIVNAADLGMISNVMPSYWYKDAIELYKPHQNVIVDSGAHTLQENGKVADFWGYHNNYKKYIQESPLTASAIWVELDVDQDTQITTKEVNDSFEDLQSTGSKIMRVWHKNRGTKVWEEYTKQFDYVGLSALDGLTVPQLNWLVMTAYKNKCRVHGFGCGRYSLWSKVPFYSVDSTTPIKNVVYGKTMDELGRSYTARETDYKNQIKDGNINLVTRSVDKTNRLAAITHQINQTLEFEKSIRRIWHGRNIRWDM